MSDYISRESAVKAVFFDPLAANRIRSVPAANVVARKTGKWIPYIDKLAAHYEKADWIKCSLCHHDAHYTRITDKPILSNYCPNCGAQMRGETDG